jgi:Zn finger protein HypA/HybF involved in hydrogenase expression
MPIPIPSVSDIIKLIKSGATIEAQEKIIELRQALMDCQEENLSLRQQVQDLRSQVESLSKPSLPRCPRCGKPTFALKESKPDDMMGAVGMFRRKYECTECGLTEDRLEGSDPSSSGRPGGAKRK